MAEVVTRPEIIHVDFGGARGPEFYDRAATGELIIHEVAFGEDNFAAIFVPPRETDQTPQVAEAGGVVGAIKKALKWGGDAVDAPDPNVATDDEKGFYVELIRQRLAAQSRKFKEPVFYLQQMAPATAGDFARDKRGIV